MNYLWRVNRISQEEHKNRTELSKEGDHTNQDRKLQERQPPNQTCPRKNIILHHAKASKNIMASKRCAVTKTDNS
ncbi:hypothetical protein Bca4012_043633 [Brassica carinata]